MLKVGGLLQFFAPEPAAPPLEDKGEIDRLYRRYRLSTVTVLTLSYGCAYTCRLGLSVIKKPLIDNGIYSAEQLGWIGATFLWGYGAGKLINGVFADRVSIRAFLSVGIGLSAMINLAMGCTMQVYVAMGLWLLNGWAQGVGAPSSMVGITRWFSGKERGTMYGIWSTAHSIGEGLTYVGTAALVSLTFWNFAFWGPGLLCLAVAVALYVFVRDRPRDLGLPPVDEWKGEKPAGGQAAADDGESVGRAQMLLLKTPAFWVIGLASASMYVTRYAINNWGILYLQEVHGFSLMEAGSLIGLNTVAGIGGCAAYGFISDRLFKARRPPLTLIFGILEVAALVLIFYGPASTWLISLSFILYGFTLSGLVAVLGGLFAVDIAPRKATGFAMGLVGAFSYVGAGAQELISGILVQRGTTVVNGVRYYDFSTPTLFWVGASVVSLFLASLLWRVQTKK